MEVEIKLIRIGSSLGFIIPKLFVRKLGWKVGDKYTAKYNSKDGSILYRKRVN